MSWRIAGTVQGMEQTLNQWWEGERRGENFISKQAGSLGVGLS